MNERQNILRRLQEVTKAADFEAICERYRLNPCHQRVIVPATMSSRDLMTLSAMGKTLTFEIKEGRKMKAGKTQIECGTKIKIIKGCLKGATGEITHAFGCYGFYDHGAVAGAWINDYKKWGSSEEVNLFKDDFEVIN